VPRFATSAAMARPVRCAGLCTPDSSDCGASMLDLGSILGILDPGNTRIASK